MRKIENIFVRLLIAIVVLFIFNYFEPITHLSLPLNIFNVGMIACFDVFGLILCIILRFIL